MSGIDPKPTFCGLCATAAYVPLMPFYVAIAVVRSGRPANAPVKAA